MWEDSSKTAILAMAGVENGLGDIKGATEKAGEEINNSIGTKMESAIRKLKDNFAKLGQSLLPAIEGVADGIETLSEFISKLNPEVVESVAKFGALALALATVGKGVGGFVSGIGKGIGILGDFFKIASDTKSLGSLTKAILKVGTGAEGSMAGIGSMVKVLGSLAPSGMVIGGVIAGVTLLVKGWKGYNEVMDATSTTCAEDLSFMGKVMNELTGHQIKNREEMIETGAIYKDFSENVSKDFKNTAISMREDVQDFNMELKNMNMDGVLDEEEQQKLSDNVNKMCDSAISAIENRYGDIRETLGNAFNSDGIIDVDEEVILKYYNDKQGVETAEVQRMQGEINELLRKVREEGYVLTSEDEAMIQNYYSEISRMELEAKASNNDELLYAQSEFRYECENLDRESAERLLQQNKDMLDERNKQTTAEYDVLIANLQDALNSEDETVRTSAERKLQYYEEQKNKELEMNRQYYNENIETVRQGLADEDAVIDEINGDIMSKRDMKCNEQLTKMQSHYDNLGQITEDGMYRVYNTETQTYDNLLVDIDENTGKIVGLSKIEADERGIRATEICGYNEDIKNSNVEMATDYMQNVCDMQNEFNDYVKAVETGTLTQDEAWNRIMSDVDNGKIKISDFGYTSEEEFGKAIRKLLETADQGEDTKGVLDRLAKNYEATVKVNGLDEANEKSDTLLGKLGGLVGKVFSTTVEVVTNNIKGKKALGGSISESGVYNVNERGIETLSSGSGVMLSSAVEGDYAYLSANSNVNTAMMTEVKMNNMVTEEVNRQSKAMYNAMVRALRDSNVSNGNVTNNYDIDLNNPNFVNPNDAKQKLDELSKMILRTKK